jgi:AAA domain
MQAVPKQNPSPVPSPARMSLTKVVSGKIAKPIRALVWGTEGIGKSTFGSNAPSPIFLGAEDGTSELDVARFPEPQSWQDACDAVLELVNAEHSYQTLVIDTLDWLEPLCWAHVCATRPTTGGKRAASIEDYGYGKGYAAALDEWRRLLSMIERLRTLRSMHVVLLAHGWIKPFKNPDGEDYDRFELKLHPKAGGLLKEWCDSVLFANYETLTHESNGRSKGLSTGARVLHTQRRAAFDAKNRYDLPDTLPLDWHAFHAAVQAHRPADPNKLKARIAALLERAPDDIRTRVTTALTKVGDNAAELARIADKLAATVQIQIQENQP